MRASSTAAASGSENSAPVPQPWKRTRLADSSSVQVHRHFGDHRFAETGGNAIDPLA